MTRPIVYVSLGVLLIGGAVAAWQWPRASEKLVEEEAVAGATVVNKSAVAKPRRYSADEPVVLPYQSKAAVGTGQRTPKQVVDKLEQDLEYPLNSRPLRSEDLKPERARDRIRPLGGRSSGKYYYSFNGNRLTLTEAEALHSHLVVYSDAAGDSPVPLQSVNAELIGPSGALGPIAYLDNGADGDLRANDSFYTNVLSPVVTDLPHGTLVIMATFTLPDGTQGKAKLSVFHTPSDQVPATFTGAFKERIEDGSLVIAVQLDVKTAGTYVLEADLYAQDAEPLARATFRGALAVGTASADLLFFGKIFHDANAVGPYRLQKVRGYLFMAEGTPNRQLMVDYDGEHATDAYELSALSADAWQSTQKSRALQGLRQQNR